MEKIDNQDDIRVLNLDLSTILPDCRVTYRMVVFISILSFLQWDYGYVS